jgi:Flp pilus assembly protein CpaB
VKRSNRLVILVGVLLAILAFVAIVILLNQGGDDGSGPNASAEPETVTVLVATQPIAVGDPIVPDVVEPREVSPDAVQGTALSDPSQVSGQPALFAIPEGSQVSGEAIGQVDPDDVDIPRLLQPGEKAIAIRVDAVTGMGFLVQPGDTIDLVVSAEISVLQETADSTQNDDPAAPPRFEEIPGLEGVRTVKAVLQDKRVLYVSGTRAQAPEPQDTNNDGVIDEQDDPPSQAAIESVIIVFAGTAQDAEVVRWTQRDQGELSSERTELAQSISVIVRHDEDDAVETTVGVTIDSLVAEYGLRIPAIVEQLNEETPAP